MLHVKNEFAFYNTVFFAILLWGMGNMDIRKDLNQHGALEFLGKLGHSLMDALYCFWRGFPMAGYVTTAFKLLSKKTTQRRAGLKTFPFQLLQSFFQLSDFVVVLPFHRMLEFEHREVQFQGGFTAANRQGV